MLLFGPGETVMMISPDALGFMLILATLSLLEEAFRKTESMPDPSNKYFVSLLSVASLDANMLKLYVIRGFKWYKLIAPVGCYCPPKSATFPKNESAEAVGGKPVDGSELSVPARLILLKASVTASL